MIRPVTQDACEYLCAALRRHCAGGTKKKLTRRRAGEGKGSLQICYPTHVLGNLLALRSMQAGVMLAWSPPGAQRAALVEGKEVISVRMRQPVSTHEDLLGVVDGLLEEIGLDRRDTGGAMTFAGLDPLRPTVLKVEAAVALIAAAGAISPAIIWRLRRLRPSR
jgi:hypothetical protein